MSMAKPYLSLLRSEPSDVSDEKESRLICMVEQLKAGARVLDSEFDDIYPNQVRKFSSTHWSPVGAIQRVVGLLQINSQSRLLDIGSGAGKFCVVGSLISQGSFTGIEQRGWLVKESERCSEALGAQRAIFLHGNALDIDWSFFNCFYLYNPFFEQVDPALRIDQFGYKGEPGFRRMVSIVQQKLEVLPAETKVVTFHGFGGGLPPSYKLIQTERFDSGFLDLWIKRDSRPR
jgi:hypothetical protein